MNTSTRRSAIAIALTTGVVLLALGLASLGFWQLGRAQEKRELLAAFDAEAAPQAWFDTSRTPPRYTRVWLDGRYLPERQILIDGQSHNRQPGYQVLTPFELTDGSLVIVNRGWRGWQRSRTDEPAPPAQTDRQRISGRLAPLVAPGLRLGPDETPPVQRWPHLAVYPSHAQLEAWLERSVAVPVLLLGADQADGFVRDWRPAHFPPSRHVGYAVQWFLLAIALLVLFALASRKGKRP